MVGVHPTLPCSCSPGRTSVACVPVSPPPPLPPPAITDHQSTTARTPSSLARHQTPPLGCPPPPLPLTPPPLATGSSGASDATLTAFVKESPSSMSSSRLVKQTNPVPNTRNMVVVVEDKPTLHQNKTSAQSNSVKSTILNQIDPKSSSQDNDEVEISASDSQRFLKQILKLSFVKLFPFMFSTISLHPFPFQSVCACKLNC